MKKRFLVTVLVLSAVSSLLIGCTSNYMTKNMGGSMTIRLEPNQKLVNATWKDDNLWYLTKPMNEDDKPDVSLFQQKSEFGLFEGTVTFVESKK